MQAGDAGDGGDHHARKKLHGSHVALVECAGRRGQNLEYAQGAAIVAKRRDEDGADAEAAATGEVDARVAVGIVTEHDFPGAYGFGGDAAIGLQADAEVGSGAASAGAADDFIAGAQCDGGSGSSGEMLGTLGDGADGGFEIEFGGLDIDFFSGMYGAEAGDRMSCVGDAKLTAKSG